MAKKGRGKLWVFVMLTVIVALPLGSLFVLEKGFKLREEAPASDRLIQSGLQPVPDYFSISHRGDTITRSRMLGKVCIFNFVSYACGKKNDSLCHQLFEIQEDYYGKTKAFRIISPTISPATDHDHELNWMAERYSAREVWHFVHTGDSVRTELFSWFTQKFNLESDLSCPHFVYLVDGEGFLRGCYDPLDEKQFHDLYNDVLFLINKLDVNEQTK